MPSRAVSTASVRHAWRRFRCNGRASAAVEFALAAPVFFALLFAIIETGVMFFAGHLLFGEISYLHVPAVGYVMEQAGITPHDVAYTRPRQSLCVFYPTTNPFPANCPTL
jgi:hypothetical protein